MKKLFATLFAASILLASVPAFACGGQKKAQSSADDTVMTATTDGDEATCTSNCDGDEKKAKKAKKETSEDETQDGEV